MEQLLRTGQFDQAKNREDLGRELDIPKYRVTQFLMLLDFPPDLKAQLRRADWVSEGQLRPFTRLDAKRQRVGIERLLGRKGIVGVKAV